MIIHTGMRTDIPAFYTPWLLGRLQEGFVLVRSPYDPQTLTRYDLSPSLVDLLCLCSKNPAPLLDHMDALKRYETYWHVTITPYGPEIEPGLPDKRNVIRTFQELSRKVGPDRVVWRYDPIFVDEVYTEGRHLEAFAKMARALEGYTRVCIISFIDLYAKVRRNFPQVREVETRQRIELGREMVRIAAGCGMTLRTCSEGDELAAWGADCRGCMTREVYEQALGRRLIFPRQSSGRKGCACWLGADIGAYDSCGHFCRYCYANSSRENVLRNRKMHDPASPLLIGYPQSTDRIRQARQESWLDRQMSIFDLS